MNRRAEGISFIGALILTIVVVLAITIFMTGKSSAGIGSLVKTEVTSQKDVGKSNITNMAPSVCSGNYSGIMGVEFSSCTNACTPSPNCQKCEGSDKCVSDATSSACASILSACSAYRDCIAKQYCIQKTGCTLDKNCKCTDKGVCVNK